MARKKIIYKPQTTGNLTAPASKGKPRCGLCGKTTKLTKTPCCDNWICDDEDHYVMFSYARNSCFRNHNRYTLCAFHHNEGHTGRWQDCPQCRDEFKDNMEMYVDYGTNENNFEKLENPPEYESTRCHKCGQVIIQAEGGYSYSKDGYCCSECMDYNPIMGSMAPPPKPQPQTEKKKLSKRPGIKGVRPRQE